MTTLPAMPIEWLAETITACQKGDDDTKRRAWAKLAERLLPHMRHIAEQEKRGEWFRHRYWVETEDAGMESFLTLCERIEGIKDPAALLV